MENYMRDQAVVGAEKLERELRIKREVLIDIITQVLEKADGRPFYKPLKAEELTGGESKGVTVDMEQSNDPKSKSVIIKLRFRTNEEEERESEEVYTVPESYYIMKGVSIW